MDKCEQRHPANSDAHMTNSGRRQDLHLTSEFPHKYLVFKAPLTPSAPWEHYASLTQKS